MSSIFLSHSFEDRFFAMKLAEYLRKAGVDVWIDEAELKIGDSLIQKISKAIKKTDYVAAVLSHNSISSSWVQKELSIAMTQEIAGRKVKVLPILLEKCEIPEFLKDKLYADFTNPKKFGVTFSRLLHAIGVPKPTSSIPKKSAKTMTVDVVGCDSIVFLKKGPKKSVKTMTALEIFEDIKITGVDKSRLYKPDPEKLLYHIYFKLSTRPPREWVQIFEEERRFPRHPMWRRAWGDGQYIIVHCSLDEIKKYHLRDIKQDVDNTNLKYRGYLHQQAIMQDYRQQREEQERKEIKEAFDGLNFE